MIRRTFAGLRDGIADAFTALAGRRTPDWGANWAQRARTYRAGLDEFGAHPIDEQQRAALPDNDTTGETSEMADHIISDDLHAYLIDQGWTPPADLPAMVRTEQDYLAEGGTPLGGATGVGVVMVHIRHRHDMVIAVNADTYRHAEEIGEVYDLLHGEIEGAVEPTIAPLWDLVTLLGGGK